MTRMRHPDQKGRMAVEDKPGGRMPAAIDGFFEGTASGGRKAVLTMHGRTASISVDYGAFSISSNGIEVRKHSKKKGWERPDNAEIERFKKDVARTAEADDAVADYLRCNPKLR